MLLLASCSVKTNSFIGARDYDNPKLPANSVKQTPAYYVSPQTPAESDIVFVKRPRPQPDFISNAPANYEQVKLKNSGGYTQVLSLGRNSKNEVSLLIAPYKKDLDANKVIEVFNQLGISVKDDDADNFKKDTTQVIEYFPDDTNKISVYPYYNSLMISVSTNSDKQKSKKARNKNNQEVNPGLSFEYMNNLRELLINI